MIDIEFSGLQRLGIALSALEARFSDYSVFWNDFALGLLSSRLREVFETEGYGRWSVLDPSYAESKAMRYPGRGILERTGAYREAATTPNHPGNVWVATATELMFGVSGSHLEALSGDNYAERHELGLGVSERQVFGLLAADGSFDIEISELLERWAADEISEVEREHNL